MSCYTGTCDEPKVRAFFASYVENADSVIDSDFVQMLNKWFALFESLKKRTTDVQTYSKQVQARLRTVASKVNSVKANICKNNACKGSTPANAFKKCKTNRTKPGRFGLLLKMQAQSQQSRVCKVFLSLQGRHLQTSPR
jgi:hypothetical protein